LTAWNGRRLNPPPRAAEDGGALVVSAAKGSDLWRDTSYGFRHENGHALLRPFEPDTAIEVSFVSDFDGTFDQAGALLWVDEATWLKTGIEISDGVAQLGAVATRGLSDWSMAPVPDWHGRAVTVRLDETDHGRRGHDRAAHLVRVRQADRRRPPERRVRRVRPREGSCRRSAARMAVRHSQLRRRRAAAGIRRLQGNRPVSARLWNDALSVW